MKNEKAEETQRKKRKESLLEKISKIIIIVVAIAIALIVAIYTIQLSSLYTMENKGIDGIGQALAVVMIMRLMEVCAVFLLPLLMAAICGVRFSKGKSKGKLTACWTWGIISLVCSIGMVYLINEVFAPNFETQSLSGTDYREYNVFVLRIIVIVCAPSVLYLIACYKEQFKNNIILNFIKRHMKAIIIAICAITFSLVIVMFCYNKKYDNDIIKVSEVTLPTLKEFETELKARGFIYDLPEGYLELTNFKSIVSEDNQKEHQNSLNFKDNANDRYPVFIYSGYVSLIQKSDETAEYYTKGPEDWWIGWDIYYVNGQIYAVIGDESELDKSWQANLFATRYGRIISEQEKITTYNRKGNYFSYGGGIKNNYHTYVRYLSTQMTDHYNSLNCAKIVQVNRVDAETLDSIAKELSPKYWIEYKSQN